MGGSAIRMINYEPALSGGYRRISGYQNDYGTVAGSGAVLGVNVNGNITRRYLCLQKTYFWV